MTASDINNRIHPLLDEGLNDEQKKAVLCMQNAVVAAGAGSGKTFVFARRFSHLIVDMGFDLDSILALTFTNKAASEMYARIYKTLKTLAPSNECAQKALEDFHKARIQTMDSYCASVLRSASRIYGIPPDFVTDVQKITEYVSKEALSFALRHRKNPALQELCALSPIDQIARDFFAASILQYSVIAHPFDFDSGLEKQIAIIADTWKRELAVVDENAAPLADLIEDCENAGNELLSVLENNRVASSALCEYMSKLRSPDIGTGEKKELSAALNAQLTAFFESLYALKRERAAGKKKPFVLSLRSAYAALSACANYILHFDHVMSLIPLLGEFESKVSEWKRVSGILSFADISSLALKILIEQPHIRHAEKERIRCIMIDEFQDNNEQQRDMLFLLAEHTDRNERSVPQAADLCPDKLFFVGDEKQSIYLFRGADVSVFRKLKNDLSGGGTSLAKNYRSSAALIAAFNRFFGGFSEQSDTSERSPYSVFLQKESILPGKNFPLFEAEYTKALAGRTENNDGVLSAPIHFFLLNTKNSSEAENTEDGGSAFSDDIEEALSADENEAVFVAAKIASLIRAGTKPEDIAVLFRSYSRQDLYEKHLRLQGVPYSSETVTGFFSDAPVNDIYYFLRLIVYPQDMHAFAAVLASPFVRLKQKAVLACIESVRRMPHNTLSVLFCEQAGGVLQGDDAVRFNAGLQLYKRIRAKTSQSCTDIIDELWYRQGYRYETLCRTDGALFAELYDYLYELARSADAGGKKLGGFVETLAELAVNQDKLQDIDIPLERSGSVRLMSIHKSKGLEFPIVFICSASSRGRGTVNTDKLYVDKDGGISFNFPPIHGIPECSKNIFFDSETEILKQKAEAELRRLLYVAFTRAEREVYVSASYALSKDAEKKLEALLNEGAEYSNDDDFLLRCELEALFAQRSESAQDKENRVSVTAPEFCDPNDTFFAFLLPVIVSLCSDFKSRPHKLPFTLERIPLMSRRDIFTFASEHGQSKKSLQDKSGERHIGAQMRDLVDIYEKIPGIQTPVLESLYRSPSQLSPAFSDGLSGEDTASGTILGGGHSPHPACSNIPLFAGSFPLDAREGASYSEVDDIVHSFSNGEFAYNHFGTIAHAFTEAAFTGLEPKVPPETVYALSETQKKTVFAAAKKMADAFINSDLGQQAQNAVWRKNEYSFKLRVSASAAAQNLTENENDSAYLILNGQIDLVFETDDGIVTVVDFKTDAHEKPSDYVLQLAAYRRAASVIRNKELSRVKTYVYYLRSRNTADISGQTEQADLNAAVFKGNSNK